MKALESAMRFGCPLLVQDVEAIDPILNPILNKEVRERNLIMVARRRGGGVASCGHVAMWRGECFGF